MAIQERALGLQHPELAETINSIAALHQEQGDLATAEQLYRQAGEASEGSAGDQAGKSTHAGAGEDIVDAEVVS